MTDNFDEALEFSLKVGTVESDGVPDNQGEGKVPAGMLHPIAHEAALDPAEVDAAIKMLSEVRKRLGQAREAIKKVPGSMMTDLARGEATQEIVVACAWIEEARECLKKPLALDEEVPEGDPDS